jgi:hypothetical protein
MPYAPAQWASGSSSEGAMHGRREKAQLFAGRGEKCVEVLLIG